MTALETYTDTRGAHSIIASSLPTGDPIDGGWALIDRFDEGDFNLVAWEPSVGEGEPGYGNRFEVYEVGEPEDTSDWVDVDAAASTVGLDAEELLELMRSEDVTHRALGAEVVAAHYGWAELTAGAYDSRTIFELRASFGDAFDAPELDLNYEELGSETGLRITGTDFNGDLAIVEWGWVEPHPDYEEEVQRVEYLVGVCDLFDDPKDLEAVLLLDDTTAQARAVAEQFRKKLSDGDIGASSDDVTMVAEIGGDQ